MNWFGPSASCGCCDDSGGTGPDGGDCCRNGSIVTQITYTISGDFFFGGVFNGTYIYNVKDCVFEGGNSIEAVDFSGLGTPSAPAGTHLQFGCRLNFDFGGASIFSVVPPTAPGNRLTAGTSALCSGPVSGTDILGRTHGISLTFA